MPLSKSVEFGIEDINGDVSVEADENNVTIRQNGQSVSMDSDKFFFTYMGVIAARDFFQKVSS